MATSKLDMSLDDIKKLNAGERRRPRNDQPKQQAAPKQQQQQQQPKQQQDRNPLRRAGGDSGSSGPIRSRARRDRGPNDEGRWRRDAYQAPIGGGSRQAGGYELTAESRVLVENLNRNISQADLQAIFEEHVGQVKAARLYFDSQGSSTGTGEVVFANSAAAHRAASVLNAAEVEGRSMFVKVVADVRAPPPAVHLAHQDNGRAPRGGRGDYQAPPAHHQQQQQPRRGGQQQPRRQQEGGRGQQKHPQQQQQQKQAPRGGRRAREEKPNVTEADLDSMLDAYTAARGSQNGAAAAQQ